MRMTHIVFQSNPNGTTNFFPLTKKNHIVFIHFETSCIQDNKNETIPESQMKLILNNILTKISLIQIRKEGNKY